MANTKIPVELSSTPGIVDGSNATAITIDSSERVGIGETSPLSLLHVKTADSSGSADSGADELVLENSGDTGMTILSGTSNSGSIRFGDSDDNDNGIIIYNHGSSPYMRFFVDASERMRISSSGNVGIGSTSPAKKLSVKTDSAGAIVESLRLENNAAIAAGKGLQIGFGLSDSEGAGNRAYIESALLSSGSYMAFATNDGSTGTNEAMRIDASGKVGVGTTAPAAELHVNKTNAGGLGGRLLIQNTSSNSGTFCQLILAPTAATAADRCVVIQAENTDGNNNQAMVFKTSAGDSPAERMRINSSGNLLVGTTSSQGLITAATTGSTTFDCARTETSTANNIILRNGNGAVGSIQTSGSSTSYNTSSDQRLKENITDSDEARSKVNAIQVRKFNWKVDGSYQPYGMIAQELQSILPEAVSSPEKPEEMLGIDYSKLVPLLTKAIQEQQTLIETQQTTINDLKSRIETLEG